MKNLDKILKSIFTMLAFVSLFTFTGCSDDDAEPAPTQTIAELINTREDLSSLKEYMDEDLMALLGAAGENTFFAPDNNAFVSLLQTPGFPADIASINPAIIKAVLAYHIIAGQTLLQSDFTAGAVYATVATGESITMVDNSTITGYGTTAEIDIKEPNVKATNGVLHITKSVLIPPTIGGNLSALLGTIAGTLRLSADFTYMAALLDKADAAAVEASKTPATSLLASDNGGDKWTVFAPSNGVFEGMAAAGGVTVDQFMASITDPYVAVLSMISSGVKGSSNFTHGDQITDFNERTFTLASTDVTTQTPTGWVLVSNTNVEASPAPLYLLDIANGNGVIHVAAMLMD